MKRTLSSTLSSLCLAAGAAALLTTPATAQSTDDLVKNALSAAPEAIAMHATVADGAGNVLREGSNGWVCLPDDPERPGNSPMCLDEGWLAWADAWMNRKPLVAPKTISFGYMLQGDFPTSNVDPYATAATADNEWIEDGGPHVMMLVPDLKMLEGMPTDPDNGGPYVMWRGTDFAHVMIPTPKLD
jgi:hypothetical protein